MRLPKNLPSVDLIVLMKYGSHLYGTNTPESDTDYKGVYMPSKEDMFLGKIKKVLPPKEKKKEEGEKNTKEDVDIQLYSLQYFIKLACEGQTVALDMLHAPNNMLLTTSSIWGNITGLKHLFYTKNLNAFIGYAQGQAAKYGIKGSRLNVALKVMNIITEKMHKSIHIDQPITLSHIWEKLPITEHSYFVENTKDPNIKQYQINGKILQHTMKLQYAYDILLNYYEQYGERARLASENKNIDWKAVSHALRAAYQVEEILTEKTITFPLKQADWLKKVKSGKLDYKTVVSIELEKMIEKCKKLSEESDLPEVVDVEFWDKFIIKCCEEFVSIY